MEPAPGGPLRGKTPGLKQKRIAREPPQDGVMRACAVTAGLMAGMIALCALCSPAHAKTNGSDKDRTGQFHLSGFGATNNTLYAYDGLIIPFETTIGETGFFTRIWTKSYKFSYKTNLAPDIRSKILAFGYGFVGEAGYQWRGRRARLAGYAGLEYRRHILSPNDPRSTLTNKFGLMLSADGSYARTATTGIDANVSYSVAFDELWLQARPYHLFASGIKAGPDFAVKTGPDYSFSQIGIYGSGWTLDFGMFGKITLGAHAGLQIDYGDGRPSPYGGMAISFFF